MKKVTITIDTVNSAFEDDEVHEVARILRKIADRIESGECPSKPMDFNGNSCGSIVYE